MPKAIDLTNRRSGRLMAISRAARKPGDRNVMWRCQCDCGRLTEVAAANFGKSTLSCGCLARETAAEVLRGNTHQRTHNKSKSAEYGIWNKMKQRCQNPRNHKYRIYGGRGISVCDRWDNSFEAFLADMGPRPSPVYSIDRIDNDRGYEPGNCRWATKAEQARNARFNRIVTIDGQSMCVLDWCLKFGLSRSAAYELTRKRRAKDPTPIAASIEEAVRILYERHSSHRRP